MSHRWLGGFVTLVDNPLSNTFALSYVTDGLVGFFDPAISYSGSGTTVTNLVAGGTNGSLVNGPTYSAVNGGVFVLDGTNDYIDIPINLSSGSYTVMGASRYTTVTNARTFSAKNNNWLMGHWNNTTLNYYAEGWVSGIGAGPGDTNWRMYAATGNTSADTYSLYVNGSKIVGPSNAGSQGPNGLAIGSYAGSSEFSASHIGVTLLYNIVLTDAQILQNYNVFKTRYGLA